MDNNTRKLYNYDFSELLSIFGNILGNGTITSDNLKNIEIELNRFFSDSVCKEVIYTNNTDKMFFGIKIVPMIDADSIYEYLLDDEENMRIKNYIVELDSHLFNPTYNLSPLHLVAMLLHEINSIVGSSDIIKLARDAVSNYMTQHNTYLRISKSIHYREILGYGLKDYLSKAKSMFYTNDPLDIVDEFATSYGLAEALSKAYSVISNNNIKTYENGEISKFIVFAWTLNIYDDLKTQRIGAVRTLKRAIQLTGSRLEQLEMNNVIRRINRIDDDALLESADEINGLRAKIKAKLKKHRLNNLKNIDNEFYELAMQVRNVEDENDALYLMRQINTNISIVEEYCNSSDCDEYERDKWNQVLQKLIALREKLSATTVYKNTTYGIFVKYPEIVDNRY